MVVPLEAVPFWLSIGLTAAWSVALRVTLNSVAEVISTSPLVSV